MLQCQKSAGCEPVIRACVCVSSVACSDANPPEFFHVQLPPVLALLLGAHSRELLSKPVACSERPLRQRVTVVALHGGVNIQCCSHMACAVAVPSSMHMTICVWFRP